MALRVDEQEEKRGISIRKRDGGTEPGQLNSLCRFPLLCQQVLISGLK